MNKFKQRPRIYKPKQSIRINKPKQPLRTNKPKQPLRILKPKQFLRIHKPKQPLGKFNNPFHKFKQNFPKSRLRKMYQYIPFRQYLSARREFEFRRSKNSSYKYRIRLRKQFFRKKRFLIPSRNHIHYKNLSLISGFIGFQGKIIPRRVTKITLSQQRLMTTAIKKARILCLLPFLENERHFKKKWRQILKRRRENENKKKKKNKNKFRKTPSKTEPETFPKTEPKSRSSDGKKFGSYAKKYIRIKPGTPGPKTEPETFPKTEPKSRSSDGKKFGSYAKKYIRIKPGTPGPKTE
jgi:small subunit ribosomal protein S18